MAVNALHSIVFLFLLDRTALARLRKAVLLAVAWRTPVSEHNMDVINEIRGKAQDDSERRAVDELINKLQSRTHQSEPAPATAAELLSTPPQAPSLLAGSPPTFRQVSATPSIAPPPIATHEPAQNLARAENPVLPAAETARTMPAAAETGAARKPPTHQPATALRSTAESEMPASAGNDRALKGIGRALFQAPDIAAREGLPTVDPEIYFEFASARLSRLAMATLAALERTLLDRRLADRTFVFAGYTDARASLTTTLDCPR